MKKMWILMSMLVLLLGMKVNTQGQEVLSGGPPTSFNATIHNDFEVRNGGVANFIAPGGVIDGYMLVTGHLPTPSTATFHSPGEITGGVTVSDGGIVTFHDMATIFGGMAISGSKMTLDKTAEITGDVTINDNGVVLFEEAAAITGDVTISGASTLTSNADTTINGKLTTNNSLIYMKNADLTVEQGLTINGSGATFTDSTATIREKLEVNGYDVHFDRLNIDSKLDLVWEDGAGVFGSVLNISDGAIINFNLWKDSEQNVKAPVLSFDNLDWDPNANVAFNIYTNSLGDIGDISGTQIVLIKIKDEDEWWDWESGILQEIISQVSVNDCWKVNVRPVEGGGFEIFAESSVPEPGTWGMLLTGAAGLGLVCRRRMKAAKK